jgi:processing peptidase subunit beta|tara:strand:- start:11554 stop:12900 length:1347 start_codon:yes stop_codon:yes gene_type:complete
MRVATEHSSHAETATVGVWIDAGSRYETQKNNGTAHFLEHMAFKGTAKRTTSGLEEEIENMGGHLNAYTSREQTTYYAKVFKKDIPQAVDILSDILQNSALSAQHVERERGVILREMEEVEKEVEEVLFDHLHATAFQHTGLGRTILGSAENVRSITRDDLATYINEHYTASRMVLVGTGAVEHDALVKLAETAFAKLPTGGATVESLVKSDPAHFTGSEVRIRDDDMTTASFCVAFKGAEWNSPDAVPLMVMQAMLGSWDKAAPGAAHAGSPLAQALHANDLANSFMAFNTNYADSGLFGVHVSSDNKEHLDDAAFCVMQALRGLIYDPTLEDVRVVFPKSNDCLMTCLPLQYVHPRVQDCLRTVYINRPTQDSPTDPFLFQSQVTRAKQQLKSSLLLHYESSTSAASEEIGRQLLTYGRRIPRAELFARYVLGPYQILTHCLPIQD